VVTVVDDLSGKLKIEKVTSVQHAQVESRDDDGNGTVDVWTVTTQFKNTYSAQSTKLTIQANKSLYNTTTGEISGVASGSAPSGYALIPNAKFVAVNSAAGQLAVLELN
jgi:hypothetical protein